MARTLNNEVDVLNIASLDNDIKDSFTRAMITEDVNTTSAAARRYLEGEYFIHTDRYLYKALEDIAAGTTITPDVNAEVVTVSEELVKLFAQSPEGIFEILSNIENTSVASKNYVKGSQFIWTDKKLYEATDDIASGSTFVVGTNIKLADNLTSQIQTLKNNDDAILNVIGAKNLLPNNATSQTVNNVTYTVNSDGSVKVNGTASSNADLSLGYQIPVKQWFQKEGTYVLSFGDELDGQPQNETLSGYFALFDSSTMQFQRWCIKTDPIQYLTITKEMIESSTTWIQCLVRVWNGKSVSNRTVYPMIRPASIADDTYVPYAMTNKKLTDSYKEITYTYDEMTGTTNANGMFLIANRANRIPISAIPVTQGVTVLGIWLNQYNVYYAKTDKNNTEITLGVFRRTI